MVSRFPYEQWLAAVGMAMEAERAARRPFRTARSVALIAADAASEMVLGVMAGLGSSGVPASPENFNKLLGRAQGAAQERGVPLDATLSTEVSSMHRVRNTAVHQASDASVDDVRRAIEATRGLIAHIPRLAHHVGAVPAGGGVASAVAAIVRGPGIARYLRLADEQLAVGDHLQAADAATRAWDTAIRLSYPYFPAALRSKDPDPGDEEGTLFALVLGMRTQDLLWLRQLLGTTMQVGGDAGLIVERSEAADDYIRREGAEQGVELVSIVIFRMYEAGLLDAAEAKAAGTWEPYPFLSDAWRLSHENTESGLSEMP